MKKVKIRKNKNKIYEKSKNKEKYEQNICKNKKAK
jgi:hypothetical protein